VAIRRKSFNRPKALTGVVPRSFNHRPNSALLGLVADQAFRCFADGDEPLRDRAVVRFAAGQEDGEKTARASASAWTFVLRPPLERPIACFCSSRAPPSARSGYRSSSADHRPPGNRTSDSRAFQHLHDAADDAAVVHPLAAAIRPHCSSLSHNKFLLTTSNPAYERGVMRSPVLAFLRTRVTARSLDGSAAALRFSRPGFGLSSRSYVDHSKPPPPPATIIVEQNGTGIASGRDTNINSPVAISTGITPEMLAALTRPWEELSESQRKEIAKLQGNLDLILTSGRSRARWRFWAKPMFPRNGSRRSSSRSRKNSRICERPGDDAKITELKAEAQKAIQDGELGGADDLLPRRWTGWRSTPCKPPPSSAIWP